MKKLIIMIISTLCISSYVTAENYLVWGTTRGDGAGTTNSGTSFDCSAQAGGFGTVSRDLWSVNSSTGASTNIASFDTGNCDGLTDSGVNFNTGSYVDKNTGNFYALQDDNTFKVYNGTTGTLISSTATPSIANATIVGLSHTGTSHIVDPDGFKMLEKRSDGSIHIGENSLVTREENGRQSLYAVDATGSSIDLDVNNGSDLLVNGTSVMNSIKATTALGAAFTSITFPKETGRFSCGVGLGHYSSENALATSCGKKINDDMSISAGGSHLINSPDNLGDLPKYALKIGFSYTFGNAKKKVAKNKVNNFDNISVNRVSLLERQVLELKEEIKELSEMKFDIVKLKVELEKQKRLATNVSY